MTCYSWRVGDSWESLAEHVEAALSRLDYFEERGYGRFVETRIEGVDGRLLLRSVVLLHDLGKAAYQNSCGRERCSFKGHEFISAYAIHRMFREEFGEEVASAAEAAIMLHHHTMKERFGGVPKKWRLDEKCLEELYSVAAKWGVELRLELIVREGTEGLVRSHVLRLENVLRERGGLFARAAVLLYPLMIVDNLAALERGGGGTVLGGEALKVYKWWVSWRVRER